ncbi:MAG TPA: DUF3343 domain-containing protein [Tissierellaceae bacterium]
MNKEVYGVITFMSTHHTIQAEGILKEKGITFKTIPTPREITRSCGLAILFTLDDLDKIKKMVDDGEIIIANIHKLVKEGPNSSVEKIL